MKLCRVVSLVTSLALILNGCGSTRDVATPPTKPSTPSLDFAKVAAWGDSLTEGNQDGSGVTYPGVLQLDLHMQVHNGGAPGATSSQVLAAMLADTPDLNDAVVIWCGRNDRANPTQVISDIQSMVDAITAANKVYLILSVPNGESSDEWKGTPGYQVTASLNAALAAKFPGHYLDIRSALINQFNPSDPIDSLDQLHDVPPASLRSHNLIGSLTSDLSAESGSLSFLYNGNGLTPRKGTILQIDSETMYVTDATSSGDVYTVAVERGYATSQIAPHVAGSLTTGIDVLHLNANGYTFVAGQVYNWLTLNAQQSAIR
jgi:lysophospholipase L1-like esterase